MGRSNYNDIRRYIADQAFWARVSDNKPSARQSCQHPKTRSKERKAQDRTVITVTCVRCGVVVISGTRE